MKTVILVADFEFDQAGHATTGYTNIAVDLGNALTKTGKYKVYGYGFSYQKQETQTLFGINAVSLRELPQVFFTLNKGLGAKDVILVSDIPVIDSLLKHIDKYDKPPKIDYYGIYAIEADPLCLTWGMAMSKLKRGFPISEFGTNEAKKIGLPVEHYCVPVDTNKWQRRTKENQEIVKEALGLKDKYVMFVNADGNERKNISGVLEGLSLAIKTNPELFMVLLTRKNFQLTWCYDDLAMELGITNNLMIINRGISQEDVWKLYCGADSFWNISKAEGLCLPMLEAMAVGILVVATNATAMIEHCRDGRGYLLDWGFKWIDPFGNGRRYFVMPEVIAAKMLEMADSPVDEEMVEKAHKYVEERTVERGLEGIMKVLDE